VPRSTSVLALLTAFVVLVGVTVVGVIDLWPEHRTVAAPSFKRPPSYKAEDLGVVATPCRIPGARACRRVTVRLGAGPDRGATTTFRFGDGGPTARVSVGDRVLVYKNRLPRNAVLAGGVRPDAYAFSDFERKPALLWLAFAFALVVIAAGRWQGVRALLGLAASLIVVVAFVVPAILDGKPPSHVAALGALGVMLLTIPLVHGANAKSLAACLGTAASLLLTLGLATAFTNLAHLTGLTSDEAVYLQATSSVSIRGLLLAGMLIGALGVLADTTVTQASTVITLRRANPSLRFRELVTHATAVGRDHIAATVNTLVLAYTGAALPVLLIFSIGGTSLGDAVNSEVVAQEIVAAAVGSIGLIAAVPLTTALAALLALKLPEEALRGEQAHVHAHQH
jgi:uncharacterized membrane protein